MSSYWFPIKYVVTERINCWKNPKNTKSLIQIYFDDVIKINPERCYGAIKLSNKVIISICVGEFPFRAYRVEILKFIKNNIRYNWGWKYFLRNIEAMVLPKGGETFVAFYFEDEIDAVKFKLRFG